MSNLVSSQLIEAYVTAKEFVVASGFAEEIDWQDQLEFGAVEEPDLLREAAWVVLNSGMREQTVRKKFPLITAAFHGWRSAEEIVLQSADCRRDALETFNHTKKIDAIISIATNVWQEGFERVKKRIAEEGVEYLASFNFIGAVTRFHLAKNLGLDVVKPDRHLNRVATAAGFPSPCKMCEAISAVTGDKLAVVDLVIWRFATLRDDHWRRFEAAL
jgi:hypothetical protein